MYRVIKYFTDLQDNGYAYRVGDEYPHPGFRATKKRINELSSNDNKQGVPLIAETASVASSDANAGESTPTKTKAKRTAKRGKRKDVGTSS